LVRGWIAAGQPMHRKRLGSFERWSSVIGGILDVIGVPGFLGNLAEQYENADDERQAWLGFVTSWWGAYGDEPKKVRELNDLCDQEDLMVVVRGDGSAKSQEIRLGKALGRVRDKIFGEFRLVHVRPDSKHKGGMFYRLAKMDSEGNHDDEQQEVDKPTNLNTDEMGMLGDFKNIPTYIPTKHPHSVNAANTDLTPTDGDVGDVLSTPAPHARGENETTCTRDSRVTRIGGEGGQTSPTSPSGTASSDNKATYTMGMFDGDVHGDVSGDSKHPHLGGSVNKSDVSAKYGVKKPSGAPVIDLALLEDPDVVGDAAKDAARHSPLPYQDPGRECPHPDEAANDPLANTEPEGDKR